jgi:hypothetical protein
MLVRVQEPDELWTDEQREGPPPHPGPAQGGRGRTDFQQGRTTDQQGGGGLHCTVGLSDFHNLMGIYQQKDVK